MRIPAVLMSGACLAVAVSGAAAQDYPNRPIRIVVPVVAGGSPTCWRA
jgi:tripartite-type tricarboxylate transporter receptor subunit TctC